MATIVIFNDVIWNSHLIMFLSEGNYHARF